MNTKEFLEQYTATMDARNEMAGQLLVDSDLIEARFAAEAIGKNGRKLLSERKLKPGVMQLTVALNIYQHLRDGLHVATMRNDLAVGYFLAGDTHRSLAAARDAQAVFIKANHEPGLRAVTETLEWIRRGVKDDDYEDFLRDHLRYAKEQKLPAEIERTKLDLDRLLDGA